MSFDLIEGKLQEAEYFLGKMKSSKFNIFAARCYFNAFLSASRSVTFTLQFVMKNVKGFEEWYGEKEAALRSDTIASLMKNLRNESEHTGVTKMKAGRLYRNDKGATIVEHFIEFNGKFVQEDAVTMAKKHLSQLKSLVQECHAKFSYDVDPEKIILSQILLGSEFQ